jgi:hypothetical protein
MGVLGKYSVVKCWLVVALLCCTSAASAQLALGLKVGGNIVTQQVSGYSTVERTTYHAGAMMNAYVADFSYGGFAVQPELLFSKKGCMLLSQNEPSQKYVTLNYLELPVGFSYLILNSRIAPYITVAPFVSCLIAQKNTLNGAVDQDESLFPDLSYKWVDFGIKMGGGIEIVNVQLSAFYAMGLNNISKSSMSVYNRAIEFSLGYFFLR